LKCCEGAVQQNEKNREVSDRPKCRVLPDLAAA
jgi:hypothetical protein